MPGANLAAIPVLESAPGFRYDISSNAAPETDIGTFSLPSLSRRTPAVSGASGMCRHEAAGCRGKDSFFHFRPYFHHSVRAVACQHVRAGLQAFSHVGLFVDSPGVDLHADGRRFARFITVQEFGKMRMDGIYAQQMRKIPRTYDPAAIDLSFLWACGAGRPGPPD